MAELAWSADSSLQPKPTRLWNRSFAVLWFGLVQSYLGDTFLAIGLMWLVFEHSGSARAAGTVLVLEGIPKLLGPLAGVIVDRSSKRMLMIGGDLVRGAVLLGLFGLHLSGALVLWHVYAGVVVVSAAGIFYGPSLKVLLPTLVNDASLPAANSAVQAGQHAATIAGGLVAGLVLAAIGAPAALLIDGISFVVAAAAVSLVKMPGAVLGSRGLSARAVLRDLVAGFRFILGRTEVLMLTLVIFACNLVLAPVNVIFPVYSAAVLGRGVEGFGYMVSAIGVGLLIGSMAAGVVKTSYPRAIVLGLLGLSAALAALGWTASLVMAIAITGLLGALVPFIQIPVVSQLQRSVPRDFQGRVFATMSSVASAATPLGAAIAGQALAAFPIARVFLGAAAGVAIVALFWQVSRRWVTSAEIQAPST